VSIDSVWKLTGHGEAEAARLMARHSPRFAGAVQCAVMG
jgi:hypothetical protein